jgi:alpha-mannosidase
MEEALDIAMPDLSALFDLRIRRFVTNQISPALYRAHGPLTVTAWDVPGEPVPFAEAVLQHYRPFAVGSEWSRPWGTTWFHVVGSVPSDWDLTGGQAEMLIDLGFTTGFPGFQAEALVWHPSGRIVKAIEPMNTSVPLAIGPGGAIEFYVEAASNPDVLRGLQYTETPLGDPATAGGEPLYRMRVIEVAIRDLPVWELAQDIRVLDGLWRELGEELPRRAEIIRGLERMIDVVDPDDVSGTAGAGREALAGLLASPAYASAHRLVAVGHAHIDSAWLWPVRETIRKCARTFSNVLALMDEDDEFVFACSSAQQFAWMKEFYPELFSRIRSRVLDGRFVPVGGMWVESDTNLPGGEALARQFIAGKGFFIREFGVDPSEVWLPDSFGYSAALPQIARAAGCRYFLTQKSSWNETNTMPHHSFNWEGIDGSRVFTHFPPVDTYNAVLSAEELARAQRQYKEKGDANTSLVPFGYGNGGGGPTREMIAAGRRERDLEGSPRVEFGTPLEFFSRAEAELAAAQVWSGELYLEFHRGTYTSQARTKRGNRRSEHLLREAELWAAAAAVRVGAAYPYAELDDAWHTVLLQQFHDILPGSSIAWVYQVAEEHYERIAGVLEGIIRRSLAALAGPGDLVLRANAGPYAVDGAEALGASVVTVRGPAGAGNLVDVARTDDGIVLDNALVRVTIDADGLISSFVDLRADRELVAPGERAAVLWIFRDTPAQWDAWDIDVHYQRHGRAITEMDSVEVVEEGGERVVVRVARSSGASTFVQEYSLEAGRPTLDLVTEVDWHERRKLLKLAFPFDVHAERASSEIQFGHINRPTHANTSWDSARFETSAHRWVHVGEPGYGVAVANDSTYGHDITRSTRAGGGTTTLVRESLLRAPTYPDPHADQGRHVLRTSVRAGAEVLDAAAEGYRLNVPPRPLTGGAAIAPLIVVDDPAVVVEAVKLAEDRSGDLVVRLYEARGAKARARLRAGFDYESVSQTDLLEREIDPTALVDDDGDGARLSLRPFQLVTLRFRGVTR